MRKGASPLRVEAPLIRNGSELEHEPGTQLEGPRILADGAVLTKIGLRDVAVRVLERRVVEEVVAFRAKLEISPFPHVEVLIDVPVEVPLAVQSVHVAAKRSEVAEQRLG